MRETAHRAVVHIFGDKQPLQPLVLRDLLLLAAQEALVLAASSICSATSREAGSSAGTSRSKVS